MLSSAGTPSEDFVIDPLGTERGLRLCIGNIAVGLFRTIRDVRGLSRFNAHRNTLSTVATGDYTTPSSLCLCTLPRDSHAIGIRRSGSTDGSTYMASCMQPLSARLAAG
ncbi:hypothetical protein IFM46972_07570 [Aspergillus udagawae]|uniref:Uncharacterized protein n=1 Tax=Aspergillus udagawae TaxID=91492 RepID=A0A8H3S0I5_9EURO|nr:hypothetical protein IFM46972_07570 [Aspergillus udagawae]